MTNANEVKKRVCRQIGRLIFILTLFFHIPHVNAEALEEEKEAIFALVIPSPVIATVTSGGALMATPSISSVKLFTSADAHAVEIIKDYSGLWYFVKDYQTGKRGWIHRRHLEIPEDPETITVPMSRVQLERFVNILGCESETKYLVWTDISRQVTHIFHGAKDEWRWVRTICCATGSNESPTIRGVFKLSNRGDWFYSERLNSGARYWVRFHDTYLFHSHIMDENKNIIDTTLSIRKSNGCVRMAVEDAKWFYQRIPDGSTVLIH